MTPSPARPRFLPALLAAALVLAPAHALGQRLGGDRSDPGDANPIAYTVRTAFGGWGHTAPADAALPELDTSTDPWPLRVLQSDDATWVVAPGDRLTVRDAAWVLHQGVPVTEAPGGILVRGWSPPRATYHDFSFRLDRGSDDRDVAGRRAEHYRLTARLHRSGEDRSSERERVQVTADLWLLPGVPFSWAPFGADPRALPTALPRLRDELGPRLGEIGLVGRAVVRIDVTPVRDGRERPGGSQRLTAFEIADLGPGLDAPTVRGPTLDRSLVDAMERLADRHPRRVCRDAAHGELPAVLRSRVTDAQRAPLLSILASRCG